MRAKWWAGLLTIAVVAPLGAHADTQVTPVFDLWYSGHAAAVPDLSRAPVAVPAAKDALPVAAMAQPVDAKAVRVAAVSTPDAASQAAATHQTVHAVNTYQGRDFKASTAPTAATSVIAPTHAAATGAAPTATAAPEMNSGLAAAGLTLLFGSVAILRRSRSNAR